MSTLELLGPEDVVAGWPCGSTDGGPTEPVFSGGDHIEADNTMTGPGQSARCGTARSGSSKYQCR